MKRSKVIQIPLYFHRLKIVVAEPLPISGHAAYVTLKGDLISIFVKPNVSAGVIAHEAVHIVNYVFQQCYIALDLNNDEPQAYLTGWVVEQVSKFVNR